MRLINRAQSLRLPLVNKKDQKDDADGFIMRLIIVYCRSRCVPVFTKLNKVT